MVNKYSSRKMEVEEGVRKHNINDIFGYRKIAWKIRNYLPATCGNDWVIRSPEFCVYSPKLTKWRLCLMPRRDQGNYFATMYLERLEYDPFPDKVHVLWRLCYPVDNGKELMSENTKTFLTNWAIGTEIPNIQAIEQNVFKCSDNFIVKCHIIVYNADNPKLLEVSEDAGLKSLSQDLSVLCARGTGGDTKVFADITDMINVHKAILCCRNTVFKNLIDNDPLFDLYLPLKNLAGVRKLVRFLYTGDLKYVLRIPSFSIEEAIKYFDVQELKPYYSHDELTMETTVVVSETEFVWTVRNLDKIEKGFILGHYMKSLTCKEIFRLALYPKGISGKDQHMSLQVKFSEGVKPRHLCIYFGLIGIGKVHNLKCMRWAPGDSEHIILDKFVARRAVMNSFVTAEGNLKLLCKLQRSETIINKPVIESETYPVLSVNKAKHYDILSKQLASLLESGDYSDIRVRCKILQIKVHKMIIGCRSHVLAKMFKDNSASVSFADMEPNILLKLLRYLYSGVLKKCDPDEILKIYDAAKTLSIQSLINTCSNILQENFGNKNAVEALLAAHRHKDLKLKLAAFKFVCCNIDEIQLQEGWQKLINEHPSLYRQWTDFRNSRRT